MNALRPIPSEQRGAALVVGLVMLMLITLLVTSAFQLSNTGMQSVGNVQTRDEAIAAANKALDQVLSSPFTDSPSEDVINVDIDNDDNVDYVVRVATPTCVSAKAIIPPPSEPSRITLPPPKGETFYQTVWDLNATVRHTDSGTEVRVRQGVRKQLTELEFNTVCS
jgi:hypothetical protein